MSTFQPRVPPGVPEGGRWRSFLRPLPQTHLDPADAVLDEASPDFSTLLAERRRQLLFGGYSSPVSFLARRNVGRADRRDAWWERAHLAAEDGHEQGDYPRMERGGETDMPNFHRMAYSGAGVEIRMPSAASIRRFSGHCGSSTFDVPVSIATHDDPNHAQVGWVRVTRCADGTWASRPLGFGKGTRGALASEAVSAIVESRRPTRSLEDVGDLLERRRAKMVAAGVRPAKVSSTWLTGLGYEPGSRTMVMTTRREIYGYSVDQETFARVARSPSPGATFNEVVKGRSKRVDISCCTGCGRFHLASAVHRCPPREAPRPGAVRPAKAS